MDAALVVKLGPAAKNLVKDAEQSLYSVVGYSGEIKGSDAQKRAQAAVDEAVMRQKRWAYKSWHGFDHSNYKMVVVVQGNAVYAHPTPELYALLHEYDKLQSQNFCVINDSKISERKADPFYQWIDSLKTTGDEKKDRLIRKLKNNFGDETELAQFVWNNKPQ
jgi:hypothetical protein